MHNFTLDIDNILDNNAENIFFKNISETKKRKNSPKDDKSQKNKEKNKFSDYLKNGFLDYSFDSNSPSKKEKSMDKEEKKNKKQKKQNFILKSELFNSPDNDKSIKSEKVSPKSSVLK